jgi:hypothetical protein
MSAITSNAEATGYHLLQLIKSVQNRLCADCGAPVGEGENCFASLDFGVWICSFCADIHSSCLGRSNTSVKRLTPLESWTGEELSRMRSARNNLLVNAVLERHIPSGWTKINASSSVAERNIFIEAKYSYHLFELPNYQTKTPRMTSTYKRSSAYRKKRIDNIKTLPSRIVDFFVTISIGDIDSRNHMSEQPQSLEELYFTHSIISCFPPANFYPNMPLPDLIGSLVFPNGLSLSKTDKAPFLFSFVLTDINRVKIFCTALVVHELVAPEDLKLKLGKLSSTKLVDQHPLSVVYSPKALVIVSHYGFFNLYSEFLKQIFHASLSACPVPIERYIANFVCELPLPPQGHTEVAFCLPRSLVHISRPPKNKLPMAAYSYRFAADCFYSLVLKGIATRVVNEIYSCT